MKSRQITATLLTALILTATIAGCAATEQPVGQNAQTMQLAAPLDQNTGSEASDVQSMTYTFTDSCGREVELPVNIDRIAPSGALSQIVLYTLCPDKLVGLSIQFDDMQSEYIDEKYTSLPVFGNFYGETLNLESVMLAAPQVIIDIGPVNPTAADDMDSIQGRTGIPAIFIHMDIDSMLTAYETLGRITGETGQAQKLSGYIDQTLSETSRKISATPVSERPTVYYGLDDGLTAIVSGVVHSEVIELAGGINVAEVEQTIRGGASMISIEQLMLWNPDVMIFESNNIHESVASRAEWSELGAIKTGRFYEIPNDPYNWIGRPPSVNRILGIKWLSNLLYPDIFDYDMIAEAREFFRLFYHCEVSNAQIESLLSKSTFK